MVAKRIERFEKDTLKIAVPYSNKIHSFIHFFQNSFK